MNRPIPVRTSEVVHEAHSGITRDVRHTVYAKVYAHISMANSHALAVYDHFIVARIVEVL